MSVTALGTAAWVPSDLCFAAQTEMAAVTPGTRGGGEEQPREGWESQYSSCSQVVCLTNDIKQVGNLCSLRLYSACRRGLM